MPIFKTIGSEDKRRLEPAVSTGAFEHEGCDGPVHPLKRHMSMKELLVLLSMSFSYALCFNTLNNIVIPKFVGRIGDNTQSLWLGLMMVLGAACQMSAPLVGAYSDRVGNRALFLVYGSALTVIGLFMFILVELTELLTVLCIAQVISTVGLSVIYSMVMALLTDHVLEEQTGKGSGAMALHALVGSGVGYAMLAADVPVAYCLCSYVVLTLLCLILTLNSIPNADTVQKTQQPFRFCDTVALAFSMPSIRGFPDFFLACVGRALFNCGLSSQVYLVFYVRDVFMSTSPVRTTSALSIAALFGGFLGAIPSGVFSDRIGRKPVVYASLSLCTVSLVFILLVRDKKLLYFVGFLHGFGSASYLSVDHALGILTLPRKFGIPIDAAKDLGLFATSATLGTLVGQVAYGTMLQSFVGYTETGLVRYSYFGFVVIFSFAALAFVASGITVMFIRIK